MVNRGSSYVSKYGHSATRRNRTKYNMNTHKSMQKSGTEAIRTQMQPSKQKGDIANSHTFHTFHTYKTSIGKPLASSDVSRYWSRLVVVVCQNTKRTYDQSSEQLFP